MSTRFTELKTKYALNYVTKATLKKWVKVEQKKAGSGITEEEYAEITGEEYEEE